MSGFSFRIFLRTERWRFLTFSSLPSKLFKELIKARGISLFLKTHILKKE